MNTPLELPAWMTEKLARIAAKIDIWSLEQEAVTILATEIRSFPEAAKILPVDFCNKVQTQKPRELFPLERAAVIITAYDWRDVCDVLSNNSTEDKIVAQFGALAFALRQGGEL